MGRVTQGMMNAQLLRNLNTNLNRMNNESNQLSTGRKINKPSDDPVGLTFALRYRSELAANEQYQKNVDSALSWLEYTDTTLDQAGSVLQRARELAVNGANGTNPQEALDSIKSEMGQLYNQLVSIGNSQFNGKYVFNGQKTDIPPYSVDNATKDKTDNSAIQYEIGAGVKLPINATGEQVFGKADSPDNAFQVLQDLMGALEKGETGKVSELIGKIDQRMDSFLQIRSDIGAKTNRVELAQSRLKDININLQDLQSKVEDADFAEVITKLQVSENVYQASLSMGAKLITPTLVDFLR